jgi:hypothetical protein
MGRLPSLPSPVLASQLIPKFLMRALTGQPLPIHGQAGFHVRSFLHVDDAVGEPQAQARVKSVPIMLQLVLQLLWSLIA